MDPRNRPTWAASRAAARPTELPESNSASHAVAEATPASRPVLPSPSTVEEPRRTSTPDEGRIPGLRSRAATSYEASAPRRPEAPVPWPFRHYKDALRSVARAACTAATLF